VLEAERFDEFVEQRCAKFYAAKYGRPSLSPGIYFRSLLIGYFEGIGAERGIAGGWRTRWRCGALWALRWTSHAGSLDDLAHAAADRSGHASREVFAWVLGVG